MVHMSGIKSSFVKIKIICIIMILYKGINILKKETVPLNKNIWPFNTVTVTVLLKYKIIIIPNKTGGKYVNQNYPF